VGGLVVGSSWRAAMMVLPRLGNRTPHRPVTVSPATSASCWPIVIYTSPASSRGDRRTTVASWPDVSSPAVDGFAPAVAQLEFW
jgi:hypothetical protein